MRRPYSNVTGYREIVRNPARICLIVYYRVVESDSQGAIRKQVSTLMYWSVAPPSILLFDPVAPTMLIVRYSTRSICSVFAPAT